MTPAQIAEHFQDIIIEETARYCDIDTGKIYVNIAKSFLLEGGENEYGFFVMNRDTKQYYAVTGLYMHHSDIPELDDLVHLQISPLDFIDTNHVL